MFFMVLDFCIFFTPYVVREFYNGARCDGRTKDFDSFGIAGSIPVAPTNYYPKTLLNYGTNETYAVHNEDFCKR